MNRLIGQVAAALAVVVGVAFGAVAVPATAAAESGWSSILAAGQTLRASGGVGEIRSPNGRFRMSVYFNATNENPNAGGGGLELAQIGKVVVAATWARAAVVSPQVYATVRKDGNFVLYAKPGDPIWSSGTAGTGSDNRLVLRDDGNLVLVTASGRIVWSSGTGTGILEGGDRLLPGQSLRNAYLQDRAPTFLTMQRDGNVVVRHRGVVRWASNTSVPGASLLMQPNGDLVVQARGRTIWRSGTARFPRPSDGRPWLAVEPEGLITINAGPPDVGGGPMQNRIWASDERPGETGRTMPGPLLHMTPGSVLRPRQSLVSGTGHRLTMLANGNLVQRGPGGSVRWRSGTGRHRGAVLVLQENGNLVIRHRGRVLWSTHTARGQYQERPISVVLRPTGKLVAYGPTGVRVWSARTAARGPGSSA